MKKIYVNNRLILLLIIFMSPFSSDFVIGQVIDSKLSGLELPRDYRLEKQIYHRILKSSSGIKLSVDDKIVLYNQCVIKRRNNDIICAENGELTGVSEYPSILYDLDTNVLLILFGGALSSGKNNEEIISFRIDSLPNIGDEAIFKFPLMSLIDGRSFRPKVYFSENLKLSRRKIKNLKNFKYYGRLDSTDKNFDTIQMSYFKFRVDEEFSKFNWIHLATDYDVQSINDIGILFPSGTLFNKNPKIVRKIREQNEHTSIVYFEVGSYELSQKEKDKIDSTLVRLDKSSIQILLTGIADNSGDVSKNVVLANNRAVSVFNYLKSRNVDNVKIKKPKVGFSKNTKNRSCKIEVRLLN